MVAKSEGGVAKIKSAPAHLSERSKRLWAELAGKIETAGRLALFQSALEALDRADEARAIVQAEGLILRTLGTGTAHIHPAAKLELEARDQFVRLCGQLGGLFRDPARIEFGLEALLPKGEAAPGCKPSRAGSV